MLVNLIGVGGGMSRVGRASWSNRRGEKASKEEGEGGKVRGKECVGKGKG